MQVRQTRAGAPVPPGDQAWEGPRPCPGMCLAHSGHARPASHSKIFRSDAGKESKAERTLLHAPLPPPTTFRAGRSPLSVLSWPRHANPRGSFRRALKCLVAVHRADRSCLLFFLVTSDYSGHGEGSPPVPDEHLDGLWFSREVLHMFLCDR